MVIDGVEMSFHDGADMDRCWNGYAEEEMPSDWEECREKWQVKELTAKDLEKVFQYLIMIDFDARNTSSYPWVEEHDD